MRAPEDIIIKPYITEKSNAAVAEGKYTFIVNVNATKTEIKQAVERLFQVKVLKVTPPIMRASSRGWAFT